MHKIDYFIRKNVGFSVFWVKVMFISCPMFHAEPYLSLLNKYPHFTKTWNFFRTNSNLNITLINTG